MARLTLALPAETSRWVVAHGDLINSASHPQTIAAVVKERQTLHRMELRRVPLTESEADCLAEILGGTWLGSGYGALVLGEVLDAIGIAGPGSYGAKHGVDEDVLIDKVRGIGPSCDLALREAFARWWATDPGDRDYTAVGLRIV